MAAYTFKCVRVFKVREHLADEGQNHAVSILVEATAAPMLLRKSLYAFGVSRGRAW
jgi:hypothetical protein